MTMMQSLELVNAFGKNIPHSSIPNSTQEIYNDTSSDPVRVCQCDLNSNEPNRDDKISGLKSAMKGRNITLRIAAVDQVKREVKARIHVFLISQRGHLGDHQQLHTIMDRCTNISVSLHPLYAEGPCTNLGILPLKVEFNFIPCACPLRFEPQLKIKDNSICGCHHILLERVTFLDRNKAYWIATLNSDNTTSFIVYKHCPGDYCISPTTPVHIYIEQILSPYNTTNNTN